MIEDAVTYVRGMRERPLWQPMPQAVREA